MKGCRAIRPGSRSDGVGGSTRCTTRHSRRRSASLASPLGRDGRGLVLDARSDGCRARLLRRELNGVGGDVQSATAQAAWMVGASAMGPEPFEGDAARRRDRGRRAAARAEALRDDRRSDHEPHQRRRAVRRESDRRRPRRQRQATARRGDPRPGVCLGLQPGRAQQGCRREDRRRVLVEHREVFGDDLVRILDGVGLEKPEIDLAKEDVWPRM